MEVPPNVQAPVSDRNPEALPDPHYPNRVMLPAPSCVLAPIIKESSPASPAVTPPGLLMPFRERTSDINPFDLDFRSNRTDNLSQSPENRALL